MRPPGLVQLSLNLFVSSVQDADKDERGAGVGAEVGIGVEVGVGVSGMGGGQAIHAASEQPQPPQSSCTLLGSVIKHLLVPLDLSQYPQSFTTFPPEQEFAPPQAQPCGASLSVHQSASVNLGEVRKTNRVKITGKANFT